MNTNKMASFRLHTGGALGSDAYWQKKMESLGFETVVYSFEGHQIQNNSRVILDEDTLQLADEHLNRANKTLKRDVAISNDPASNDYNRNLLRRNYFIVRDAEAVFAVTYLKGMGGTAWGVQMAIDMGKPVYVFDMGVNRWRKYRDDLCVPCPEFAPCPTPKLTKEFAGIGSRFLSQAGRDAIDKVFEVTFGQELKVKL